MAARKWLRRALIVLVCLVSLFVMASTYLRIRQYAFRWRMERLVADLRGLELRKANAQDVQQFVQKWGFEPYETSAEQCPNGPCKSYSFEAWWPGESLVEFLNKKLDLNDDGRTTAFRIVTLMGGWGTMARSHLRLGQDLLWSKDFSLMVSVSPEGRLDIVQGSAGTPWRFQSNSDRDRPATVLAGRLRHKEYLVGEFAALGNADAAIWAEFSPFADNRDVARLMQFDFSCLTRLRPCKQSDLMPAAWAQYLDDAKRPLPDLTCTPELTRIVARAADAIVVAGIDSATLMPPVFQNGPYRLESAHLVTPIRGAKHVLRHFHGEIEVENGEVPATADTNTPLHVGKQYILLLQDHVYGGWDSLALFPCGALTDTPTNLAMAREAADESDREF